MTECLSHTSSTQGVGCPADSEGLGRAGWTVLHTMVSTTHCQLFCNARSCNFCVSHRLVFIFTGCILPNSAELLAAGWHERFLTPVRKLLPVQTLCRRLSGRPERRSSLKILFAKIATQALSLLSASMHWASFALAHVSRVLIESGLCN
eukprot:COSAG02_NODE_5813_length_4020_cov_1.744708_3_plen_149_part_00